MSRLALIFGAVLSLTPTSSPADIGDRWLLWSRDTRFEARQPFRQWRTAPWVRDAVAFETRAACEQRKAGQLASADAMLGDRYRVFVLETALVARDVTSGGGFRRRFMCLPASVLPPR
jgi:hypothetical protein